MKRILFALAIATAALCACNKAEKTVTPDGLKPVRFTVENLGTYSFKSTVALGEENCSKVGIYAADLGANNVQATVSGTSLIPATTIYWGFGQGDNEETTFIARYPHADAAISGAYDIPGDQSSEEAYSYHANVMTAKTVATPNPGTVAFNFKHPFAKVVVDITNNLGADAVASVVMKKVKLNATAFDMNTAPATITLADTKTDVTAYRAILNTATYLIFNSLCLRPQLMRWILL